MYRPHLTLLNFTDEFPGKIISAAIPISEADILSGITVHPIVGRANSEWELISEVNPVRSDREDNNQHSNQNKIMQSRSRKTCVIL